MRQVTDTSQKIHCEVAGESRFRIANVLLGIHTFHKDYLGIASLNLKESGPLSLKLMLIVSEILSNFLKRICLLQKRKSHILENISHQELFMILMNDVCNC